MSEVTRIGAVTVEEFRARYLGREAVVVSGLAAAWPAMEWDLPSLRSRLAGARLPLRMDDDEFAAYCEGTRDRALRDARQARRVAIKDLSFWIVDLAAYLDAALGGVAARLPCVLDVPMVRATLLQYLRVMGLAESSDWRALADGLESLIGDVAFPALVDGERDYRLWLTPRPRARGAFHADGYHNLNAQLRGHKQWIVQSPQARAAGHAPLTCETGAGDVLYIPRGWWHAATALDACINVNAWHKGEQHGDVS